MSVMIFGRASPSFLPLLVLCLVSVGSVTATADPDGHKSRAERTTSDQSRLSWLIRAASLHSELVHFHRGLNNLQSVSMRAWRGEIDPAAKSEAVLDEGVRIEEHYKFLMNRIEAVGSPPSSTPQHDGGAGYHAFLKKHWAHSIKMMLSVLKSLETFDTGDKDAFYTSLLERLLWHSRLLALENAYLLKRLETINRAGPEYRYQLGVVEGNTATSLTIFYVLELYQREGIFDPASFAPKFVEVHERMKKANADGIQSVKSLHRQARILSERNSSAAQLVQRFADSMDEAFRVEKQVLDALGNLGAMLIVIGPMAESGGDSWLDLFSAYHDQYSTLVSLFAKRQQLSAERLRLINALTR